MVNASRGVLRLCLNSQCNYMVYSIMRQHKGKGSIKGGLSSIVLGRLHNPSDQSLLEVVEPPKQTILVSIQGRASISALNLVSSNLAMPLGRIGFQVCLQPHAFIFSTAYMIRVMIYIGEIYTQSSQTWQSNLTWQFASLFLCLVFPLLHVPPPLQCGNLFYISYHVTVIGTKVILIHKINFTNTYVVGYMKPSLPPHSCNNLLGVGLSEE